MAFLYSILYLALLGLLCFPVGRLLARYTFRADRLPFRSLSFENDGRLYIKIGIRKWQNRLPDVSKLFPNVVPEKKLKEGLSATGLHRMVQETCVAEVTHVLLCIAGAALLWLWPGAGGVIFFVFYILIGNVPFILIQRYNRPRLQRLLLAAQQRERKIHEGSGPQQQ